MRVAARTSLAAIAISLVAIDAASQSPMGRVVLTPPESLSSLKWTSLTTDPKGDVAQRRLPDAKDLAYAIDQKTDLVWFKLAVYDPLPERWFGINVAFDVDGNADNGMVWWGTNKVKFDRLASAYLSKTDEDWQGYAGVADSESVGRGSMSNLTRDVKVALDRGERAIVLGIPRATLGPAASVRVIATVGSMLINNDDLPNEGMIVVKLPPRP